MLGDILGALAEDFLKSCDIVVTGKVWSFHKGRWSSNAVDKKLYYRNALYAFPWMVHLGEQELSRYAQSPAVWAVRGTVEVFEHREMGRHEVQHKVLRSLTAENIALYGFHMAEVSGRFATELLLSLDPVAKAREVLGC